jgi:acyl-CoA reductase-like NAD-dependent aldehyde dehydrogenase
MSIKRKMQEEKAEKEVRREIELAIRQFCRNMKLKADERSDTIQFIADALDEKDKLARTLALSSSATALADLDVCKVVAEYLAQFCQEMDQLVAEFTALSREAKDELATLYERG